MPRATCDVRRCDVPTTCDVHGATFARATFDVQRSTYNGPRSTWHAARGPARMMKRWCRRAVVLVVLAAIGYWAFKPAPVAADFATVERGPLEVTVEEEGRTRVRDRYVVSAPLPGRMRRIELEPGDPVIAGKTVVAQFEPADPVLLDVRTRAELQARVKAAEASAGGARAERERIRTELTFAQTELKRAHTLVEQRVISQREPEGTERQAQ